MIICDNLILLLTIFSPFAIKRKKAVPKKGRITVFACLVTALGIIMYCKVSKSIIQRFISAIAIIIAENTYWSLYTLGQLSSCPRIPYIFMQKYIQHVLYIETTLNSSECCFTELWSLPCGHSVTKEWKEFCNRECGMMWFRKLPEPWTCKQDINRRRSRTLVRYLAVYTQ